MARKEKFFGQGPIIGTHPSSGWFRAETTRLKAKRARSAVRVVDESGATLEVVPSSRLRRGRFGELIVQVRPGSSRALRMQESGGPIAGAEPKSAFEEAADFVFEEYGEALKRLARA